MGYFLTTERLGMRPWRSDDGALARQLWGDPEVTRLIASAPLEDSEIAARLARELQTRREHGIQYWPVFCLERQTLVGCCGLRPRPDPAEPEIGVHIRSSEWRRGYAREAMTAVIAYAFDRLDVRALFAGHNPGNHASRRLLESLGFVYTHDELYPPTGREHPSYRLERQID